MQSLCNYRVSVHLSVPLSNCPIIWRLHATAVVLLLLARRAGDIDRLLHSWRSAVATPGLDVQLHMLSVPRCQLTQEAEHILVAFSVFTLLVGRQESI